MKKITRPKLTLKTALFSVAILFLATLLTLHFVSVYKTVAIVKLPNVVADRTTPPEAMGANLTTQNIDYAQPEQPQINKVVPPAIQNKIPAIPVLMYHHIRVFTDKNDGANYYTSVSPDNFLAQMEKLKSSGYTSVSLQDYLNGNLPAKPIIITFDDGDKDAYTEAYPVLKSLGFKAVFYIITGVVDQPDYLTADQIKEMSDSGMIIGAHTVSHSDLSKIDPSLVPEQLSFSKTVLENMLGKPVNDFCYPFGGQNQLLVTMVNQAGYTTATTTRPPALGAFRGYLTIPRIAVTPDMKLSVLMENISAIESEK